MLIKMPLDQHLKVGMLKLRSAITRPVNATIEVPAIRDELIEEFFLKRSFFLFSHVIALFQGFLLLNLLVAKFKQVLDNTEAFIIEIAPIDHEYLVLSRHSLVLIAKPAQHNLVSCDNKLVILRVILFISDDATEPLKHDSSLAIARLRLACSKHASLVFHAGLHQALRLQILVNARLALFLELILATLLRSHLGNLFLFSGLLFLFFFDLLSCLGQQEVYISQAFGYKRLQLLLDVHKPHRISEIESRGDDRLLIVVLRLAFFLESIEVLGIQHVQPVVLAHQNLRKLL